MSDDVLYTNYEDAQRQADSSDLFVVRLLAAIHRAMLQNANTKLQPEHPFDVRYYYDALVRSIASGYSYTVQDANYAISAVAAVNAPDFSETVWSEMYFVQSGMADRFVGLVQNESKDDGAPFDLNFACQIAGAALDVETFNSVLAGIGEKSERVADSCEDWLAGFTAVDAKSAKSEKKSGEE